MMNWLLKSVTGNPMTLVWIALGAFAAGAVSGGGAAWRVQGYRLDAVKSEYSAFKASVDAAGKIQAAENKRKDAEHSKLISQKDAEHDKQMADSANYWTAYAKRVRADANRRAGAAAKRVPITSKICNNEAADHRLSGAVERARQDLRSAIAEYREGLARLFGAAEVQTADLVNVQEWAAGEAKIEAVR